MGKLAIGYNNLIDSATLSTPGSAAAGHGVAELQKRELAAYWKGATNGANDMTVDIDHGSAVSARLFMLVAHDAPSNATVAVDRGTSSGGSDVLSLSAATAWPFTPLLGSRDGGHFCIPIVAPAATSARYTRIKLTGSAAWRVGRIFVGPLWVAPYNPDKGDMGSDWLSANSSIDRTESGADWAYERDELRTKSMTLKGLSAADLSLWHEIVRTHKTTGELAYIEDISNPAKAQQFSFLAVMRQLTRIDRIGLDLGSVPLTLDERGGAP